jgi:hypothetical protein
MAVAELIVSRREVLAAACAAPLSRHPGPDPGPTFFPSTTPQGSWIPDPPDLIRGRNDERGDELSPTATKWNRALARFRRAEARLVAAEGAPDHLFDALNDAFHAALRRLMRTPAPGIPALAVKIDLAIDHEIWEFTAGESCLAALSRDARHFASPRSS